MAFSCRHKELKAEVVIKTLTSDDLARDVDEVFNEARVLYQLDHPAIIRLLDCGYTIPSEKARPYFVMNFFDGVTLEEYIHKHGPLPQGRHGLWWPACLPRGYKRPTAKISFTGM